MCNRFKHLTKQFNYIWVIYWYSNKYYSWAVSFRTKSQKHFDLITNNIWVILCTLKNKIVNIFDTLNQFTNASRNSKQKVLWSEVQYTSFYAFEDLQKQPLSAIIHSILYVISDFDWRLQPGIATTFCFVNSSHATMITQS